MSEDARERWFAEIVQAGLDEGMFGPSEVVEHVTPDILAKHVPTELLGKVLEAALSASTMTPDGLLETLDARALARHIPHEVLWNCVAAAAERHGIPKADADS